MRGAHDMYGMVNQGVKTFVETHHGTDMWHRICARAALEATDFETMSSYDDAVTYSLVSAISEHLDLTPEKVLEVFGTYWVDFAGRSSLGKLMRFSGESFVERLEGLDEMHERVQLSMPHLRPPSFEFEPGDGDTHRLHYYSERTGLAPMVVGLLHGLAQETGVRISVEHSVRKEDGSDHDEFLITLVS